MPASSSIKEKNLKSEIETSYQAAIKGRWLFAIERSKRRISSLRLKLDKGQIASDSRIGSTIKEKNLKSEIETINERAGLRDKMQYPIERSKRRISSLRLKPYAGYRVSLVCSLSIKEKNLKSEIETVLAAGLYHVRTIADPAIKEKNLKSEIETDVERSAD